MSFRGACDRPDRGPDTRLNIAGCAGGTRLVILGASLRVASLAGLTLRDLDISPEKVNDPILVENCDDVAILGCRISQTTFPTDLTIADATGVRVRDSVLESSADLDVPFPLRAKTRAARVRELTEKLNAEQDFLLRFSESLADRVVVANSALRIKGDARRVFRVAVPRGGGDIAPGVGTNLRDVQLL